MRNFLRGNSPAFLRRKWRTWGIRYDTNKRRNLGFVFQWATYNGRKVNTLLKPHLAEQTDGHCSFCDNFPIRSREDSIDHFKPKSRPSYYLLAYQWENLYYCCQNCQQYKREQFNQYLLRPDAVYYSFEHYFIYSFNTNEIEPNPALTNNDRRKAETTISILGLNDEGHIAARRISLERYYGQINLGIEIFINDFPYRYTIIE
jgi:uncharacterized protein (TIGR02646 family)